MRFRIYYRRDKYLSDGTKQQMKAFLKGAQTHLPPKLSFSSDFGYFILKMLKNAKKLIHVKEKYTEISKFLVGRPRGFQKCGVLTPATPTSATPLAFQLKV